jgi:hypothetical protein
MKTESEIEKILIDSPIHFALGDLHLLAEFITGKLNESAESPVLPEISPRVAKLIIQIRDLFIEAKDTPLDTMDEIWHLLYQIASPNYDKLSDCVWKEIESIAQSKAMPQVSDELNDIIDCIIKFDFNESLTAKGEYFEVIRRDLKAMRDGKIKPQTK